MAYKAAPVQTGCRDDLADTRAFIAVAGEQADSTVKHNVHIEAAYTSHGRLRGAGPCGTGAVTHVFVELPS